MSWNPADINFLLGLSNFNRTIADSISKLIYGLAIDLDAKKVWVFNGKTGLWNNDTLANQNPASGTGGMAYGITGSICPAWGCYGGATTADNVTAAFSGSAIRLTLPTGFSAWDTLAGSATTFDSSAKGADITLSGGNLTANRPAAGNAWQVAKATNYLASGKGYFEFMLNSFDGSSGWEIGICNSSQVTNNYLGSSANGAGSTVAPQSYGYTNNIAAVLTGAAQSAVSIWKVGRATNGISSGKKYWEFTADLFDGSATSVISGLEAATPLLYNTFPGASLGISRQWRTVGTGSVIYNNSTSPAYTNWQVVAQGDTLGIALDYDNGTVWFWNSADNKWNNDVLANQNPASGTGGISIAAWKASLTLYPAIGLYGIDSADVATANFAADDFVGSAPSGFAPLENIVLTHFRFRSDSDAADATPTWGADEDAA